MAMWPFYGPYCHDHDAVAAMAALLMWLVMAW
jgi:hypothetical protein